MIKKIMIMIMIMIRASNKSILDSIFLQILAKIL